MSKDDTNEVIHEINTMTWSSIFDIESLGLIFTNLQKKMLLQETE